MINCTPKPVKRKAIQFKSENILEITNLIGNKNLNYHLNQCLVNTKRHDWQNVNDGDYLIFDEDNRLLKVLNYKDFIDNYNIEESL